MSTSTTQTEINMAYQPNRRKENVTPLPQFEIDGVIITLRSFMHNEWWYVINNTWCVESTVSIKGDKNGL
jgi:hypothetical protein